MDDYQCCFCGHEIERDDLAAVCITFMNLWNRGRDGCQDVFAHSGCAVDKIGSALSPAVPFDVDALRD